MAFLHADADFHCIYGMQRYGPTERAVALWGHEIAFSVLCTLPIRVIELTRTRDFSLPDRTSRSFLPH